MIEDLTGQKFGKLTVVKKMAKKDSCNDSIYKCKCECGEIVKVVARSLKNKNTTSCGCHKIETFKDNTFDFNTNLYKLNNKKVNSNNTSGCTGVHFNNNRQKWIANIVFQKKNYFLGYHDKKENAINARKIAEERLHGEFLEWYAEAYPVKWAIINRKTSQ